MIFKLALFIAYCFYKILTTKLINVLEIRIQENENEIEKNFLNLKNIIGYSHPQSCIYLFFVQLQCYYKAN